LFPTDPRNRSNGQRSPAAAHDRIGRPLVQRVLDRVSPHVSKWDSLASAKSDACLLDAVQKLWVMFEPVLEPILFRRKSDQDASRTTVPCDDDLLIDCESQILG
jgi:hypothetical protein